MTARERGIGNITQKQDGLLFFASINKNACIAKRTVFLDRFPLVKQGGWIIYFGESFPYPITWYLVLFEESLVVSFKTSSKFDGDSFYFLKL